jgi:hypothetical protein
MNKTWKLAANLQEIYRTEYAKLLIRLKPAMWGWSRNFRKKNHAEFYHPVITIINTKQ